MTDPAARHLLERAVLVTGNPGKAREIERILGVDLRHEAVDLPEIQDLELATILDAKGKEALARLGCGIIVDETGLELAALGGFPGPLIKWLLKSIGAGGIARVASSLGDRRVTARCAVLYRDAERSVVGEGCTTGELVSPRGGEGFGWDPIFMPNGETRTYAELDGATKDRIGHRGKALRALLEALGA